MDIIADRAERYYGISLPLVKNITIQGDSRNEDAINKAYKAIGKFDWIITSPPYYGLTTYIPDQWIRNWFLGGPSTVDYTSEGQISHKGKNIFIDDLRKVWENTGLYSNPKANLVVRFGSIRGRLIENPEEVILEFFKGTGWKKIKIQDAANASHGRRQADTFSQNTRKPLNEIDIWAKWLP